LTLFILKINNYHLPKKKEAKNEKDKFNIGYGVMVFRVDDRTQ
jgi:hypothetical protein